MERIELLSPAGSLEKLETAYTYGADSAYMGMKDFSLRANSRNVSDDDLEALKAIKDSFASRKLYCTMNIVFHEDDVRYLRSRINRIREYPFDGFIISDTGIISLMRDAFPDAQFRLSTQASCINSSSVKLYHRMGFDTIIVGRETTLDEIRMIKDSCPDIRIEAFGHGAMCMGYSGKCYLSAHMTGRSANFGDCAQVCRWSFKMCRKDENGSYSYLDDSPYSTLLSSKDLCMIDHLQEMKDAGVDSLKIEGRMKSTYYVASVTRAYRKAIDHLYDSSVDYLDYRNELFNASHREYSTGFFFNDRPLKEDDISRATDLGYLRDYLFLGTVKEKVAENTYSIDIKNQIRDHEAIEFIGPDVLYLRENDIRVLDESFNEVEHIDHCNGGFIRTSLDLKSGYIIRKESPVKIGVR